MIATIEHHKKTFRVDFSKPIDISIPLREGANTVNAYFAPAYKTEPVISGKWVGDVRRGASVNFRNIFFNPHGNGTHTECVGHISKDTTTINQCLKDFFFIAELISVTPEKAGSDSVITQKHLRILSGKNHLEGGAVVVRTLPNGKDKRCRQYSGTNPPYLHYEAVLYLVSFGIHHLLVDLPSVDREDDGGKLMAHKAFWMSRSKNGQSRETSNRTITELIYVPDNIPDGTYLLNLQIAGFENDAAPSKPVLYSIK